MINRKILQCIIELLHYFIYNRFKKISDKKINSYSQGSIDYFEIIKQTKKGNLYNVTAKVTINLDKTLGGSYKNKKRST